MAENKYLKWLSSETQTIFWHDSAGRADQLDAFENGAEGMTTNPFLINATLRSDPDFWAESLSKIEPGLSGDAKILELVKAVTGFFAKETFPIFETGVEGKGYVCAQVNPNKTGDEEYMVEQAKILASWSPNIVVKLPATNAGLKAYERCAAMGINVAATVSFTVPQVLAAGEAAARGKKKAIENGIKPGLSIAVMMVGRLDDYLRDVAKDSEACVSESDITQAGVACMKKAYKIFMERGYDTYLMPAGCRGANHVSEFSGAKMIISISPKIADALKAETEFKERIDIPVAEDVIERLMTMPEFRKAYMEDGLAPTEFIAYGATNRTTDQFINDGWNPLLTIQY